MAKIEMLLGGKTRFEVLEALAEAKQRPVTAYQIAMSKGLDPAATYRCLTEFSEAGIVEPEIRRKRNQTFYRLSKKAGKAAVEFLRSLKQETPRAREEDFEKWTLPETQAERMAKIVRIRVKDRSGTSVPRRPAKDAVDVNIMLSSRISGELPALIASSQIAFNELFDEKDGKYVLKKVR